MKILTRISFRLTNITIHYCYTEETVRKNRNSQVFGHVAVTIGACQYVAVGIIGCVRTDGIGGILHLLHASHHAPGWRRS